MLKLIPIFIFVILFSTISGCVGTIQEVEKKLTDSTIAEKTKLNFKGIDGAVATAHNRVSVSFYPASGGSGNFSYLVYVNGNFAYPAASLSSSTATLDTSGKYNVDVKNLQLNTSYTFSVRVYDIGFDQSDSNTVSVTTRTLADLLPIFDGAVSLDNLAGVNGLSQLLLSWSPATAAYIDTSGFGVNVHNISGYNVYAGASPDAMTLVGTPDSTATSFTITGLSTGVTYYARVRARNSEGVAKEDLNTTTLNKKTLTAQPIQFAGVKSLSIPKTIEGFSNITINWDAGSGTFDRYKIMIFYTNPGVIVPGATVANMEEVINDVTVKTKVISVPNPNMTYYVAVLACAGAACTDAVGQSVVRSIKTTPPVSPFNGIKTAVAADLHSVNLTWDKPDINLGVFSSVKVFRSNASGNYNELIDEITTGSAGPTLDTATTDTGVLITNLDIGTEYCFVAMAYDSYYLTLDYPIGRPSSLRIKSCLTLSYTAPGFLGVNSSCTAPTQSGFSISWNTPNPLGIFDNYDIYIKEGNSGFNFTDALNNNASYYKISPVPKNYTSYTFNASSPYKLAADTYYQIGVKTYYNDNGTPRRDTNNSFTINCKTLPATVIHNGWYQIMGLGPKINGLTGGTIIDRIKPRGEAVEVAETINLEFPQEYPTGSAGIDSSDQGIVKLMWYDFEISDGLGKLFDYAASHSGSSIGYKVYRKEHSGAYDTNYNVTANVTDSDWGSPISGADLILPQSTSLPTSGEVFSFGEFIDYTLTHPANMKTGKILYYKIEAFINGTKINYQGTYGDAVVRVVLPPANMTFAHRWMLNKKMCEDIGRKMSEGDIDRDNNYRCLYNGFSSVKDLVSGSDFYDMKGDLLTDRFRMGCNFTRGACSNTNGYTGIFEGVGTGLSGKGRVSGDCLGYNASPNTRITAAKGSIFYDRNSRACYVNRSAAASGTTWEKLATVESSETTPAGSSKILPLSLSAMGEDIGSKIYSNNAYLPPLMGGTQNNFYRVCQSNTVEINGVDHRLRLMRRKEQVATHVMSDFVSKTIIKNIRQGKFSNGGASTTRDCNSFSSKIVGNGTLPANADTLNLTTDTWRYPSVSATRNVQYFANGSAGAGSTEFCVSWFGLQDISGNGHEVLSDRLFCDSGGALGYGNVFCSSGIKSKGAVVDPAPSNASLGANLYTPEIDPANRENLKSANGHYLNAANPANVAESNTVNLTHDTYPFIMNSTNRNSRFGEIYFNPVIGLGMHCNSNSCLYGGSPDDNTKLTWNPSSATAPYASVFNFDVLGFQMLRNINSSSMMSSQVLQFLTHGGLGSAEVEGANNGRYSLYLFGSLGASYMTTNNASTGRCTTLIEDYLEQANQYND